MYKYNVRALRDISGLSQPQFSQFISAFIGHRLPIFTISRHENIKQHENRGISAHILYGYARAFGIDIAYLYSELYNKVQLQERIFQEWEVSTLQELRSFLEEE